MASGTKLGDLYFDVLLADKTDKQIKDIKDRLSNIRIGLEDGGDKIRSDIKKAFDKPFKVGIVVDKAEATRVVQEAMNKAGVKVGGMTGAEARAAKTLADIENKRLLNEQKILTERAKTVRADEATALTRLRIEQTMARLSASSATSNGTSTSPSLTLADGAAVETANNSLLKHNKLLMQAREFALQYINIYQAANFIKDLARVTGEFEKQLITLKAILQSTNQATTLFNQIKQLSLVSPFTFLDLTSFTKQLSAYQIPVNELFDTTKRLSDLSAGLGVDMSRIVLAYGQVRSAAFLRGQELRQFTEAGIPMVTALADKFSDLEGRVVSTGEVFEKISNREVPFEMVKEVIQDLTDSGGKFYNMQEKQSESLAGKLANLSDAYDIMRYNIGTSNEVLRGGVEVLTQLMSHYKEVGAAIMSIATGFGFAKGFTWMTKGGFGKQSWADTFNATRKSNAAELKGYDFVGGQNLKTTEYARALNLQYAASVNGITQAQAKELITTNQLTASKVKMAVATQQITKAEGDFLIAEIKANAGAKQLGLGFQSLKGAAMAFGAELKAMLLSPQLWIFTFVSAVADLGVTMMKADEQAEKFNQTIKESATEAAVDATNALKELRGQYEQLLSGNLDASGQVKLLEKYVEQIKNIIPNSKDLVASLGNSTTGVPERIKQAQQALEDYELVLNKIKTENIDLDMGKDIWFFSDNLREKAEEFAEKSLVQEKVYKFKKQIDELATSMRAATNNFAGMTESQKNLWISNIEEQIKSSEMMQGASEQTIDLIMAHLDAKLRTGEARFKVFNDAVITELKANSAARKLFADFDGYNWTDKGKELVDKIKLGMFAKFPGLWNEISAWMNSNSLTLSLQIRTEFSNGGALGHAMQTLVKNSGSLADPKKIAQKYKGIVSESEESIATAMGDIKKYYDSTQKEYEAEVKALGKSAKADDLKKKMQTAMSAWTALGGTASELTGGGKKTTAAKAKVKQEDAFIKQLRELKAKYDEANGYINSLGKVMDEQSAIQKVMSQPRFSGLAAAMLGENGQKTLLSYLLEQAKKRNTEDGKKYVAELEKEMSKYLVNDTVQAANNALSVLKQKLDLALRNFKLYDSLLDKTGSVPFATLFSFGRNGKTFEDAIQAQISTLNKMLSVQGSSLNYSHLAGMTAEQLQEALSSNQITDSAKSMFDSIQTAINEKHSALVTKMADSIASIMTDAEKLAMAKSQASQTIQDYLDAAVNQGVFSRGDADALGMDAFDEDALNSWLEKVKGNEGAVSVIRAIQGVMASLSKTVGDLNDNIFELSAVYDTLFNRAGEDSINTINELLKIGKEIESSAKSKGNGLFEISYDGNSYEITRKQLERLVKLNKKNAEKVRKSNPFKSLKDAIDEYNAAGDNAEKKSEAKDKIVDSFEGIFEIVSSVKNAFSDFFNAIGGDSSSMKDFEHAFGVLEGVGNAVLSIYSKNWGGLASSVGSIFTNIASLISDDYEFDGLIKKLKNYSQTFAGIYDDIDRRIARTLGGAYTLTKQYSDVYGDYVGTVEEWAKKQAASARYWARFYSDVSGEDYKNWLRKQTREEYEAYAKQMDSYAELVEKIKYGSSDIKKGSAYLIQYLSLMMQREMLQKQYDSEAGKKNKDTQALADYRDQIAELEDQIATFKSDVLENLFDINVKDWASQISDALVDAFASGESAAQAFDSTVGDIMNSVVSKMLSLYVLEPAMQELADYLYGDNGVFGNGDDWELSQQDIAGMAPYIKKLKDKIEQSKQTWDAINDSFDGILSNSNSTSSSLSSGMKSITESTADLLASYLNAIRADVSLLRMMQQEAQGEGGIAKLQLAALNQIQMNTASSAANTEELVSLLNGVIVAGSSGNRIRV